MARHPIVMMSREMLCGRNLAGAGRTWKSLPADAPAIGFNSAELSVARFQAETGPTRPQ